MQIYIYICMIQISLSSWKCSHSGGIKNRNQLKLFKEAEDGGGGGSFQSLLWLHVCIIRSKSQWLGTGSWPKPVSHYCFSFFFHFCNEMHISHSSVINVFQDGVWPMISKSNNAKKWINPPSSHHPTSIPQTHIYTQEMLWKGKEKKKTVVW